MRGAWIEIDDVYNYDKVVMRRSPCGERGLKCRPLSFTLETLGSLPMRGAWIEMKKGSDAYVEAIVAPHAGSVD